MKVAIFSTHSFETPFLTQSNLEFQFDIHYLDSRLSPQTARLAHDYDAIACFVTDQLNAEVLAILAQGKTRFIALRSVGFNHVDLNAAKQYGFTIARVPAYSPYAVAEFAVALILCLNRKIHRAYARTHEGNFLLEGLLGFDLYKCTVGIIGTGRIGTVFSRIMQGFGCRLLAYDPYPNEECQRMGLEYVELETLYREADIISLHCPLTSNTHHLINAEALATMKTGVMLINTGRGALIDTSAVIAALKTGKVGYLGLDVYEEEEQLFFQDLSTTIIQDDTFARLMTFPNVIITGHQAFFTQEALTNIAETTLDNMARFNNNTLTTTLVKL